MASFVSATVGISLSVVLLAIAWARETPWDRALYHAALTGGMTAMLGRYWMRQMVLAAKATQKKREEEEAKKQETAGATGSPGIAVPSAGASPVRTA